MAVGFVSEMSVAKQSAIAADLYRDAPLLIRLLATYRPYISPFWPMLEQVPSSCTLFDAGCGNGLFLNLAAASGRLAKGVGTDISAVAVAAGEAAAARQGAPVSFFISRHWHEWSDEQFDVVSVIDVIHHIRPADQHEFLRQCAARVKPGGLLIYKDMCRAPLWRAWANRLHDLLLARQWIHYLPIEDAQQTLAACGFDVVSKANVSRFVYGHEQMVMRKRLGG